MPPSAQGLLPFGERVVPPRIAQLEQDLAADWSEHNPDCKRVLVWPNIDIWWKGGGFGSQVRGTNPPTLLLSFNGTRRRVHLAPTVGAAYMS
jgi:hypothetical protein